MPESKTGRARHRALLFLLDDGEALDPTARSHAAKSLPAVERPLFVELVAGTTRRQALYDAVIAAYSKVPIARLERRLLVALRLGLHQLLDMDHVPDHAAVATTLELLPKRRSRGFANAVLRSVLREGRFATAEEAAAASPLALLRVGADRYFVAGRPVLPDPQTAPIEHLALGQAFEAEAARLLVEDLGLALAREVMENANQRPLITLRPRGGLDRRDRLIERLRAEGLEVTAEEGHPQGLIRLVHGSLEQSEAVASGDVIVQGDFAARVAALVAPRPGERILDLCAPPGGKTLHLADLEPEARVVAFVRDESERKRLDENVARAGAGDRITVQVGGDPFAGADIAACLLDVPCSNSGVLSRRPKARQRLTEKNLRSLEDLQASLLDRALTALAKSGGRVVYATCSILERENRSLVDRVLASHPRFHLTRELRSLPDGEGRDGGYAALIQPLG